MSMKTGLLAGAALLGSVAVANATPFTTTSGNGALPGGVTQVGGVVLDLLGANGTRVVSQLAASSLFVGYADNGTPVGYRGNPTTIGVQSGFAPATLTALGGGLQAAYVRITLFDGDSAPGDFDDGQNTLFVNGISFGNFSSVSTQRTDETGTSVLASAGTGFGNEILSTGFFSNLNAANLASLFTSLAGGTATYSLLDVDPNDNFYDFTRGVDGGLINVGTGPTVVGVPEPLTLSLFGAGLLGAGIAVRRRKKA